MSVPAGSIGTCNARSSLGTSNAFTVLKKITYQVAGIGSVVPGPIGAAVI
jgi:hypothetical protein